MIAIVCTAVAATALMGFAAVSTDPPDGFTACMRAHGLPDFPDTTITSDGRLQLEPGAGALDPFSSEHRTAMATCADELPAGTDLPAPPHPPAPPRPPEVPAPADSPTPPEPPEVPEVPAP
jgi:hypothetical protein